MLRLIACLIAFSAFAAPNPFLEQHCHDCHDAETKKGGLDLTALSLDAAHLDDWIKVHAAVERGEMPPKKNSRQSPKRLLLSANWTPG